ncbi:MAG: HAMP domain-containing sensor histidine kinase [Clostridia bacterium]|nr:HAMP domain-containing sensor histidine kinase [Clostridia bacterium]
MQHTIRAKFGVGTFVTISIVVATSAMFLFTYLGSYLVREHKEEFTRRTIQFAEMTELMFENQGIFQEYVLRKNLIMISNETAATMLLLDRNKRVVVSANTDVLEFRLHQIPDEIYDEVLGGKTICSVDELGNTFSEMVLYVMHPVRRGEEIVGVAMCFASISQITIARDDIMKIFLMASLFACAVSILFAFMMTNNMTRPIKEMSGAAKEIASGDFNQRVGAAKEDELRQLAESFNQMIVALEELEQMRSSFVSNVSHELRTPMTVISGFVDGVLDGTIPPSEHEKYIAIVQSEIKRLSRLVNELLETAKLENGGIQLHTVPFDINELIRRTVITYESSITTKNIDVTLDFSYEKCYVKGDYDAMYRVMNNLLDNAMKFTPINGRITVTCVNEGANAKITLENSGAGIKKEDLPHIWERFYKTDKSRSMDRKGAGLGLYIVKEIMIAHGGDAYAESEEGKYTRFSFTLPSVKYQDDDE